MLSGIDELHQFKVFAELDEADFGVDRKDRPYPGI